MQLMFDDDWTIPLRVDARLGEALEVQRARAAQADLIDLLSERLGACICNSLADCLDADLQLPSKAQLKYGEDIARELGIALPAESLRYKGAMSEFIERFHEVFLERRAKIRRSGAGASPNIVAPTDPSQS